MKKTARALATLILSLALPFTAYAGTWQQDSTGWKVQSDDGSYLTNQWYQNTDGKWYYLGADGYMLTSTTTPDGYQVDNNGVWIQPTQSEVQPTQSQSQEQQLAPGALSIEEIERREAEAGMGHHAEGEVIRGIQLDPDAGEGYNWQ